METSYKEHKRLFKQQLSQRGGGGYGGAGGSSPEKNDESKKFLSSMAEGEQRLEEVEEHLVTTPSNNVGAVGENYHVQNQTRQWG